MARLPFTKLDGVQTFLPVIRRAFNLEPAATRLRARVSSLHIRPMAGLSLFWCGLIENNCSAVDDPRQRVTAFATNVAVHTFQCERRSRVMVEQGGLPFGTVVALAASSNTFFRKLLSVNVLVTIFTLGRSRFEVDIR